MRPRQKLWTNKRKADARRIDEKSQIEQKATEACYSSGVPGQIDPTQHVSREPTMNRLGGLVQDTRRDSLLDLDNHSEIFPVDVALADWLL